MKALVKQEGFNFTRDHLFGNLKENFREFSSVCGYSACDQQAGGSPVLFDFMLTDDYYIQVTRSGQGWSPVIIAQFLFNGERITRQVRGILEKYITEARHWNLSYPGRLILGRFFFPVSFEEINSQLNARIVSNTEAALKNPPGIITRLRSCYLMPEPHGGDDRRWLCVCPGCNRKLLVFSRSVDDWRCGFCGLTGQKHEDILVANNLYRKQRNEGLRNNPVTKN